MTRHFSLLFLLFSNIFLTISGLEKNECSSTQTCLPKDDCPAVVQLWDDFKKETDKETKLALLAQYKSLVCSLPPEPKFCCDTTGQTDTTTTSPEEQFSSNGTFLPRSVNKLISSSLVSPPLNVDV